jgi:phenylpyruvate tautomerase PptA (4-oxalocrotonate tautomerase family)
MCWASPTLTMPLSIKPRPKATVAIFEEVASGDWAIGGQSVTTDDAKALARGEVLAG